MRVREQWIAEVHTVPAVLRRAAITSDVIGGPHSRL